MNKADSVPPESTSSRRGGAGWPRTARMPREERRLQLLDVASDVFAEKGYHSAAMDDIAEAAGVSKPVLYQHFPSKLDLYQALVDRACQSLTDMVEEAIDGAEENLARVDAAIAAFYHFVADSGRSFRFVFESDLTGDADVQMRIWKVHQDLANRIGAIIALDTRLPEEQAKLLGISLVGMAQVGARYWISDARKSITVDEASALVSNLAWRGIRSFPLINPDRTAK